MSTTTTSGPLISANGLTKHYDDFSLTGITFDVHENEIVGLVGRNGAGKSTTIKALLGLIDTDGGTASVFGVPSATLSQTTGFAIKEQIGVVFDAISLPPHLRVADVGRIYAHAYRTWNAAQFAQLTEMYGLDQRKRVKDLSRGMGMKLSLACALSHNARLLILDEATAGLDPMARDEVLDRLRDFISKPGHAILMSTHITSDLEHVADRIICIDNGRIFFDLEKDLITDQAGVARCRTADFERIASAGFIPEAKMRYLQHEYDIDVLVPDRYDFMQRFPDIPCDRMTIDDYLSLTLKGGVR